MNEKDTKAFMAYSLYDMGTVINSLFADGYTIKEGWPIQYGYMFEIMGEKEKESNAPKKAGRPPKEA